MLFSKIKKIDWLELAKRVLPYLVILLVTYITVEYQMAKGTTLMTSDRFLHFDRFYDTSMQIKTGNFSLFQTNYAFNQSGRVFNALYGPFFAYLNGLLIIICRTWFRYNILIDFIVYLIGGIGMYRLGKKGKVNDFIALLLAVLYLQFGIIPGMLEANNFMGWGAAFAPYAMIQALNMIKDKKRPIHWISLTIIMAIIAQVHVLSTLIIAVTLVPFAIYGLVNTPNKKQMIVDFFKAIGAFLLLSANIWGGLLVVYSKNKIAPPDTYVLTKYAIKVTHIMFRHGNLPILVFLLLLFQLGFVIKHFKEDYINTMVTMVSTAFLLVASVLFPWAKFQGRFPVLGQVLQFPFRLIVAALPLMLLGFGITFTKLLKKDNQVIKKYIIFALILAIVQGYSDSARKVFDLSNDFLNPGKAMSIVNYYRVSPKISEMQYFTRHSNSGYIFTLVDRAEPDYLPVIQHADNNLYAKTILDHSREYKRKIVGDKMYLYWTSKKKEERILPIVMYKQSKLILNGKDVSNTKKNMISNPYVQAKKGKNVAVLSFTIPFYFWILLAISFLSWLLALVYGLNNWYKKRYAKN